jgi:4,5-dihydroxyphthalate decarboxylase
LRGRTVGVRNYLNTAALVVRGLLADAHGVMANEMSWRVGDVDRVERDTIPIPRLLRPADVQAAPRGATLADMLASGEIDALIHYEPPRGFGQDPSRIKRLFTDPATVEQEYYRSTGIFPVMHLIGIRRTLFESDPSLAHRVYDAFTAAKDAAVADLWSQSSPKISLPWLNADVARTVELAGRDFWPYGVRKNRPALESLTRYALEQGVTARRLSMDELFAPNLLDT